MGIVAGGVTLGAAEGSTLGAVAEGVFGAAVGLTLGSEAGVGATTLGAMAILGTSGGGSLEWGVRNSLVGTKGGS